jgi:hypothetical protein
MIEDSFSNSIQVSLVNTDTSGDPQHVLAALVSFYLDGQSEGFCASLEYVVSIAADDVRGYREALWRQAENRAICEIVRTGRTANQCFARCPRSTLALWKLDH